ncbi:unnamed protein product [Soboliphyme baturini]|uniref:Kunitz/Bovine pancreatic trypsin inhibitor domain protein n=1 Tax=Soboliphyme baturini TaxID=241478 RepID=A0A183IGI2_9BILA|nr:unnamed protein product [Soboliphyme baturini]
MITVWGNVCDLSMNEGEGDNALMRWFYDSQLRSCVAFTYRGLMGNPNNFMSKEECEMTCTPLYKVCSTGPPQIGPNNQPVYCSPSNPGSCDSSSWCHIGGSTETTICCTGGKETFRSYLHFVCKTAISAVDNICQLPMATGTGSLNLIRWYYNSLNGTCVMFTYSGLAGNQNSFVSRSDCQQRCEGN